MEILISMRPILFVLLLSLLSFEKELKAQSGFSDMLTCMLESAHWHEFYCIGADGEPILRGITTQNKIPLYTQLSYKGKPIGMNVTAPKSQRYMIFIKKIVYTQDFAKVKVVYDQRVRVKFKLGKGEEGHWFVIRSVFKQQYACGGKTKKKSFIWNF